MQPAPLPANELDRLAALRALLILDTPPEQRFDRIVEFAAQEFEVPVALINLIDEGRQWSKAAVGMVACEMRREESFCSYVVFSSQALVVEDLTQDPRFADAPLVQQAPHLRFYAGVPLNSKEGLTLGTLCLLDHRPRQLDATDLAILGTLGALCAGELRGESVESVED